MVTKIRSRSRGFTLIELLVVISIIGMLSSVVLASMNGARQLAMIARAQSELAQLRNAIAMMSGDTGLWPNGCQIDSVIPLADADPTNEVDISNPDAGSFNGQWGGLISKPSSGSGAEKLTSNCNWTTQALNSWNGPYIPTSGMKDPWGKDYYFDNDYFPRRDCVGGVSKTAEQSWDSSKLPEIAAIVSGGPNGVSGVMQDPNHNNFYLYDCDDIYLQIGSKSISAP